MDYITLIYAAMTILAKVLVGGLVIGIIVVALEDATNLLAIMAVFIIGAISYLLGDYLLGLVGAGVVGI